MHPGRWFNETAFDSLDYLVPALLLFVLAAAKWAWRYWHRESLRARRIVLSLLTRATLMPNKRLKLAGSDRSKGSGVLCARAHELSFNDTARGGRVARSVSAIP